MADSDVENQIPSSSNQNGDDEPLLPQHERGGKDAKGICMDILEYIWWIIKSIFNFIKSVVMCILNILGCIWYPIKERTNDCCECCGKRLN